MTLIGFLSYVYMAISFPALTVPVEEDYKLVKQDSEVTLYERWIKQPGDKKVRELKAVFDVRSNMHAVTNLLQDQRQGTSWNPHAKEYRVAFTSQPGQWVNYVKYGMPWPFDNQDCCILYQQESTGAISFKSVYCSEFPEMKNVTRMQMVKGKWQMENKGNGLMQMSYTISTDKSTKVPAWVSDPIVRNNMMETMKAFKKTLENGKAQ